MPRGSRSRRGGWASLQGNQSYVRTGAQPPLLLLSASSPTEPLWPIILIGFLWSWSSFLLFRPQHLGWRLTKSGHSKYLEHGC